MPVDEARREDYAGWNDDPGADPPAWHELLRRRWRPRPISWLRPAPLLESFNQILDQSLADVVNPRRQRWVAAQRAAGVPEGLTIRTVPEQHGPFSFLLLGDTGEADESQYAVVAPLLNEGRDTEFMVIVSDVIYPAGDVNDYVDAFYLPYAEYPKPIYALPGNHDWLDGLNGFMFNFCDADPLPQVTYASTGLGLWGTLARVLWRKSARPRRELLGDYKSRRRERGGPKQPGPYWAMDAGPIRLVAIDTGVDGSIDRNQAQWLKTVSRGLRPKILLTGKPLLVNHERKRGKIHFDNNPWDAESESFEERYVDDIVRDAGNNYIAAIGGDIHNYQRYSARLPGDRQLAYIVSGGGGAFLSATHALPPVEAAYDGPESDGLSEEAFRCYPLRGDSLLHYTKLALKHGPKLTAALLVVGFTLALAAIVLWNATERQMFWGIIPYAETTGWDLPELGTLFALAAVVGFALPPLILEDKTRGIENGLKLVLVAAAVIGVLPCLRDPMPWVIAGAVGIPVAHALLRYDRKLFSILLAGCGLMMCAYILNGTPVAHYTGEALAAVAAVLAIYLLRRPAMGGGGRRPRNPDRSRDPTKRRQRTGRQLIGAGIAAFVAVLLAFPAVGLPGGLAKVLAFVLGSLALVVIPLFLAFSGLALLPCVSLATRRARRRGDDWLADPAAPDQAARWLSENRLGNMPTARGASVDLAALPKLASRAFKLMTSKTKLGRIAQRKFSELFDSNEPPFFRSFLKVEVDPEAGKVTISCFAATGRTRHEETPPREDWVTLSFYGKQVAQMGDPAAQPDPP